MTPPTPQDPWLLPVAPHPDQAGGKRRVVRPLPVVLVSLLALAVLCCGGATLVTVFGPGKAKPLVATSPAPAPASSAAVVAPARQQVAAVPTTSSPVPTSPRPMRTTVKPSRTTTAPTSKPPTPKPKPTTPKPAPSTTRPAGKVVHAGAFCSPAGATGVTSKGKAMVCRSTATDSRNRWRAA